MQSDVISAVSAVDMASTTAEQFHSVEGPAGDAVSAMEEVGHVQIDAPDVSDIIGAMKDIQKAADRARSAVDTVDGKGGKQGGSGKKDPDFGKAVGGPVNMGQTYLVGEEGPELFTPGSSGAIIPNNRLAFGGGGDVYHVARCTSTARSWRAAATSKRRSSSGLSRRSAEAAYDVPV
jgi:SLT domain-containing protein